MEDIRRITNTQEVIINLIEFVCNKNVYDELGEPLLFSRGDVTYIAYDNNRAIGFICRSDSFLKYVYVMEDYRNNGIGQELLSRLESDYEGKELKTVATDKAMSFYKKNGFKVKKSFVKYHNLIKKYGTV